MLTQDVIDLFRASLVQALVIAGPLLVLALILGVLLGIVQTLMQIQEGTVTMIPKLLLMGIALLILLPWMTEQLVEYSRDVILNIPNIVSRGSP